MSCGSFWRSASITTTKRPRTALNPASVALAELADDLGAPVLAAVVDEDHLVLKAGGLQHLLDLRPQQGKVLRFVVDGHDDGQLGSAAHGALESRALAITPARAEAAPCPAIPGRACGEAPAGPARA